MPRPFRQHTPRTASRRPATDAEQNVPAQRLHKLLALAGLGSRRDMETLIASGRITINGKIAEVGAGVVPTDVVRLDSRPLRLPFEAELPKVLLYHKPEGEIVTQEDPENRATVFDKLPRIKGARWVAIGRLDMNTSGLLIFTTSGELANHFMHPRYEVEREYAVRIFGELSEAQLLQLTQGITLEDGPANFDVIQPLGGEGANHWYKVILKEGRNREVRRLFEALQMPVSRLIRVRFGPVSLPPRVKRAQMLELAPKEVVKLLEWAGMDAPRAPLPQRTKREMENAAKVFTPKERKTPAKRSSFTKPSTEDSASVPSSRSNGYHQRESSNKRGTDTSSTKKPRKPDTTNRRIRQSGDLNGPTQQKRSDRNRRRG